MVLPILTYPNPLLEKKAEKVKNPLDPEIRELILDMVETLESVGGLGLAATQLGKMVQVCLIRLEGKKHILINPKIKSKSWKKEILEEGCLSFPGKYIPIRRSKKVKVEAQDRKGKKIIISADGLLARALQHEIDHLQGMLFIKRI